MDWNVWTGIRKELGGYFKCLKDEGELRDGAFNSTDLDYLTDKIYKVVTNETNRNFADINATID